MNTKRITLICAVLVSFLGLIQDNTRGELPADFPGITVTTYDPCAVADGYIFLAIASVTPGVGPYVMILQNDGAPVWYKKMNTDEIYDFKVMSNGYLCYAPFIEEHSYTGGGDVFHEIRDDNYNLKETITGGNGYVAEGHDFQVLPNGNILQFGYYMSEVDMSQIVEGGHPAALVSGGIVQELDAERNVVFQWRTWDYYDFEDELTSKGAVIAAFHLNVISQDPDGHIILGTPLEIKKINRQTGEVMWILGGSDNEFTLIGEGADVSHFGGHATYRIENGNFLMYENGPRRGAGTSKVHEYRIDEVAKTATHIWTYTPATDIKAWHRGNAQRLPNGNTFIGWGGAASGTYIPACTEVTPSGQKVFELFFDSNNPQIESYRAFRFVWPPKSQAIEFIEFELATGNTYIFADNDVNTGVTLEVLSGGGGYNEVTVTREPYAPVYPVFPGKAPRVLPVRVTVDEYNVGSMTADILFDVNSFDFEESLFFDDPCDLTVYYRPNPGQGLFIPLLTNYNPVTKQLQATMTQFGEFIFCFADVEDVPYLPVLCTPENYRGVQEYEVIAPLKAELNTIYTVNQERDILLSWSPKGLARWYHIQVATDANFTNLEVDEDYLIEARYIWDTSEPNTTYYYRVNTTNEGGTSEWSAGSFATVPPMIEVTVPTAGENWKRGVKYFIKWKDNITENAVIELYKDDMLVQTIGTVPSDRAYQWQVGLGLTIGCDYSIKIKSSTNGALFDVSENFSIDVPFGDLDCDGSIRPDDLAVLADKWLKEGSGLTADLYKDDKVNFFDFAVFGGIWPGL